MAANKIPLLIISDAPSAQTGLARITRDIATRIHKNLSDIFRVATYGFGGPGSRHFGFEQYAMSEAPEKTSFVLPELPQIWQDFAGDERGVVFTVWDLSRLMWLAIPDRAPQLYQFPTLRKFLLQNPFTKWAYLPIDAECPNEMLTFALRKTAPGFHRILTYSKWAEGVVMKTLKREEEDLKKSSAPLFSCELHSLPHGIDTDMFFPTNQELCRKRFFDITGGMSPKQTQKSIGKNDVLIGIVATNQQRKDWALGIETVSLLKKHHPVRLWMHTDRFDQAHWDMYNLLDDFGLIDDTIMSNGLIPDEKMSMAYSACDLTLGIGLGEGFGYPIFESLACGTPCIHGNYGGAPEHGGMHLVNTHVYRYEGLYACKRPVYDPLIWAAAAEGILDEKRKMAALPSHLDWNNLWPKWEEWLRKGI